MPRVAIATLGCKVNQYDSEGLAGKFKESGYEVVGFSDEADVYIVNTCTVTQAGDRKSRQLLRRAITAHPGAIVVATGCYAQSSPERLEAIDGVALISGTANRADIVDEVGKLLRQPGGQSPARNIVSDVTECRQYQELPTRGHAERTRAFLKIEDGCENFCAYCLVPHVRGPVRSRRLELVEAEVRDLASRGYREIVLTGIDLGAYGRDLGGRPDLADVLRACAAVPGICRVRVSSVDPRDVTPGLIDAMTSTEGVCPHLHVPLQSGSDSVLARMNRNYDSAYYLQVVEQARRAIAGLAVTTDVIVGFPGETDEDFNATVRVARQADFSRMHVFAYSKRQGTPAAQMPDQVDEDEKRRRSARLIKVGEELALAYHQRKVGSVQWVLVEEARGGQVTGFTDDYVKVVAHGSAETDEFVKVRVLEAEEGLVRGRTEA